MKNLVVMCAPPGAGKSTFVKMNYPDFVYINQDEQGKQHLDMFHKALIEDKDIVVDRMNFNKVQRNRYLSPAKELGYHTEIVVLHESYDTCLERCLIRENHSTIKDEHSAKSALNTFFTKYERVEDGEVDKVKRIWPEGQKSLAICVDLDGTLCNIDHRLHHVKDGNKNWKDFFKGIPNDIPNLWCSSLIAWISNVYGIVLCSGRPDDHEQVTRNWLEVWGISYQKLFMRRRGDYRRDDIVKEIILDFEILTKFIPVFFIDDRQNVVDMWRRRGFVCLQCAPGDF